MASPPIVPDKLEQLIFEEISKNVRINAPPFVLDWPSGDGLRTLEMARLEAQVLAVDESPENGESLKKRARVNPLAGRVSFTAQKFGQAPFPQGPFDMIFCHHGINFMPYDEAKKVARALLKSLKIGGKLFVSAYGLHSTLGEGYHDAEKVIAERYCRLSPSNAKCYNIHEPLCLYTERNLVCLLIEIGGVVIRTFTSTHGTVKGIATRI